ncbi:MAG: asparagine synthase (glutamine-hydrolyzing) [Gammaproteobacteria bacterium]
MCGFVGIVGRNNRPVARADIKPLLDRIQHRGPDDEGFYCAGNVGFGFRRLAILDLSPSGHQPMEFVEAGLTIAFNGEVYNFVEMRAELEAKGHRFTSSGDTEVILHAYQEWGRDCLQRFNGMFAILIHDRRDNSVFGARDRFGIKPLFRWQGPRHTVFCSEIKSLKAHPDFRFEPNMVVAARYLYEGRLDEQAETFYQGVESLPAGHAFEIDAQGRYRQWQWWRMPTWDVDTRDTGEQYAELFEDAVRLRLRADVPLAVFLSGGMDSSSIISALGRQRAESGEVGGAITGYSFQPEDFDESRYVRDTLEWTGATLKTLTESPVQLWDEIRPMLRNQDEPTHSFTPVISYVLSRMTAADGVKVVLNGQGADETAAGYPTLFPHYWHTLFSRGRIGHLWHEIGRYCVEHGGDRKSLFKGVLRRGLQSQLGRLTPYRALAAGRRVERLANTPWLGADLAAHLRRETGDYQDIGLDSELRFETTVRPLPIYLRVEDRVSMAHSLEVRLPFLDWRLVSLLFSLDAEEKMSGPWNKDIQRRAMRGRIPESVRTRVDKMGFPTPLHRWFREDLHEQVKAEFEAPALRQRGLFNHKGLMNTFRRHCAGDINVAFDLFRVIQFEWWLQDNGG